jgi:hypothetical protein
MARTPKATPRILFIAVLFVFGVASLLTDFGNRAEGAGGGKGKLEDGVDVAPPSTRVAAVVAGPSAKEKVVDTKTVSVAPRAAAAPWTTGQALTAEQLALFDGRGALDKAVKKANPRLFLNPDFDPRRETNLVIGLPGWGGRSENFIWVLINGFGQQKGNETNVAVAAIQDTRHGGPQYQGQGTRRHANTWWVNRRTIKVMNHFVAKVADKLGKQTNVFFLGYSTGGVASSVIASRLDNGERFKVAGAISVGCATNGNARLLQRRGQRVLYIVVPKYRRGDGKPMRDDQWNRMQAEKSLRRLTDGGVEAYLRHIPSARRHVDWHWGLISQCRYFPGKRIDSGRGYWPNYWKPNPETQVMIATFIQGQVPPETASFPDTPCPY